jgi:hypothetical protein
VKVLLTSIILAVAAGYALPSSAAAAPVAAPAAREKPLQCPPAWRLRGGNSGTQLGDGEPIGVEPVGAVGCFSS